MKKNKGLLAFALAVLLVFAFFVGCVEYRESRPEPGDYPGSKWVYDGEYTRIEWNVGEDRSSSGRIITADGEAEVQIGYHTPIQKMSFYTAKEETSDGSIQYYYEDICQGSYQCSEKELIVTCGYCCPEWHKEGSELQIDSLEFSPIDNERRLELELVFVRVE